jgi:hypothetical protein
MEDVKEMTHGELMFLGLQKLAYVKTMQEGDRDIFAIHAADGTELATADDKAEVRMLLLKSGLLPVNLH